MYLETLNHIARGRGGEVMVMICCLLSNKYYDSVSGVGIGVVILDSNSVDLGLDHSTLW